MTAFDGVVSALEAVAAELDAERIDLERRREAVDRAIVALRELDVNPEPPPMLVIRPHVPPTKRLVEPTRPVPRQEKSKKVPCPDCGKMCGSGAAIASHRRTHSTPAPASTASPGTGILGTVRFYCERGCGWSSADAAKTRVHEETDCSWEGQPADLEDGQFECQEPGCSETRTNLLSLEKHTKIAHGRRALPSDRPTSRTGRDDEARDTGRARDGGRGVDVDRDVDRGLGRHSTSDTV